MNELGAENTSPSQSESIGRDKPAAPATPAAGAPESATPATVSGPATDPVPSPAPVPSPTQEVEYPSLDPGVRAHPPLHTLPKKPRPPQTIRNITYSIGLIAIVSLALFIFVKFSGTPDYDQSAVDVAKAASEAQGQVDFRVATPVLPATYFPSQALLQDGADNPRWTIFYAAGGGAIAVNQSKTMDESFVKETLGAIEDKSSVSLAGVVCEKTRSAGGSEMASGDEVWALRCVTPKSTLLVSGNVTYGLVSTVATAALEFTKR